MFHDFLHFFDPNSTSSKLLEFRDKTRAKGRKHFIFYTGMLGCGAPVFVLSTLWNWHEKYGWHVPPRADLLVNLLISHFVWLSG